MSCNGCRVLRKGCNENCILRQSLSSIQTAQAQANATVFVAKFFGRADLLSFLSAVPESHRPALFQSLLLEACGRTVNPVTGAVGLLWTGNWHLCQSAVAIVLRGGTIHASFRSNCSSTAPENDLQLGLTRSVLKQDARKGFGGDERRTKRLRTTPSFEVSETTTLESGTDSASSQTKLLHLFL